MIKKFSISLATLGSIGGAGGTIYHVVNKNKEKEDKTGKENNEEKKFSGSLIFTKQVKKTDTSKKIYKAELSREQQTDLEDKKCKFENNDENFKLICKIPNLPVEKEKADSYIDELNKKLENLTSDTFEELKKELEKENKQIDENFGSSIYSNIKLAFTKSAAEDS